MQLRFFWYVLFSHCSNFLIKKLIYKYSVFSSILRLNMLARGAKLISFTSLHSNSLSPSITVTTVLQACLYSMRCPDVLSSVAGCGNPPLSKAGQLVQQC